MFWSSKEIQRARANAEKGEYRRAIAALLSDPTADAADSAVQADLSRLHPRPSTPATPVPHLESLPPSLRISIPDVIRAIHRFDRTSSAGPDCLYLSVMQTLVKNNEGEDHIFCGTHKIMQQFLDGKLLKESAEHICGAQLTALRNPNGSIRPNACGIVYRRLAARLECN